MKTQQQNNPFELHNGIGEDVEWRYFFYKIWIIIKTPFTNPNKRPRKADVDLMEQIRYITTSDPTKKQNVALCREYIAMHRIIENTKARKRLEKWARRLISIYLIIVLLLVVASGLTSFEKFKIEDPTMVAILTTTTVNIIGIALIVMRGHFPQLDKASNEAKEISEEAPTNNHD